MIIWHIKFKLLKCKIAKFMINDKINNKDPI